MSVTLYDSVHLVRAFNSHPKLQPFYLCFMVEAADEPE